MTPEELDGLKTAARAYGYSGALESLTASLAAALAVVERARDVVECQAAVDAARPEFTPTQLAALRNATTALAIKLRNYDAATAGSGHAV